jgi:hypothetical protein
MQKNKQIWHLKKLAVKEYIVIAMEKLAVKE